MGTRGFIRDVLFLFVGYKLLAIWLFGGKFTTSLGLLVVVVMLFSVWFIVERFIKV